MVCDGADAAPRQPPSLVRSRRRPCPLAGVGESARARNDEQVESLAAAVLPLIRTRADLHRWGSARQHGMVMHEAVDLLEQAMPTGEPVEVHAVTHKALTSAIKVIARADDSSGVIGDACRRLLALHPRTAAAASTPPGRLVDWMIAFQFDGDVDYFELDPVAYAPALGPEGITTYRHRLGEIQERVGHPPADRLASSHRHEHWVLSWNEQRLAVLDRDADAVIRTHARDRRIARWFHDTAVALVEIDRVDLATDWARQGAGIDPFHQAQECADLWVSLLDRQPQYDADDVLAARRSVFDRWPTDSTAAQLHDAATVAGRAWADIEETSSTGSRSNRGTPSALCWAPCATRDVPGSSPTTWTWTPTTPTPGERWPPHTRPSTHRPHSRSTPGSSSATSPTPTPGVTATPPGAWPECAPSPPAPATRNTSTTSISSSPTSASPTAAGHACSRNSTGLTCHDIPYKSPHRHRWTHARGSRR